MSSLDSLPGSAFGSDDLVVEDSYRSVAKTAILAIVFAIIGLLAFLFVPLIILPLVGLVFGLSSLRSIRRYPEEYAGRSIALIGVVICVSTLLAAPIKHYYVYITEVPDGYSRVDFSLLKSPYGQQDVPPETALEYDGQRVFVKGYILPSSVSSNTSKSFILVPDIAACCFGNEPPRTHMMQVDLTGDLFARWGFRRFNLAGTLQVETTVQPSSTVSGVYYRLKADYIR